jgi:hypothetical protein
MLTSEPNLVHIEQRMNLRLCLQIYGKEKLKLPGDSADASFMNDLLGIALYKGSVLKQKLDSM